MASLDEILENWSLDTQIDKSELADEALKIAKLHHKYYSFYIKEKLIQKKMHIEHKKLCKVLFEYYTNKFTKQEYEEYNYPMLDKLILKTDVNTYIEADDNFAESIMKLSAQEEKVDLLTDIIKSINNRNFAIKSAIDFLKWTNGAN